MFSLRQLRYLIAVVDSGSFSAAARLLRVSQPALGLQIKQLEDVAAIDLLVRHSRGVELTPAGKAFLPHARRVLEACREAELAAASIAQPRQRRIALGMLPNAYPGIIAQLMQEYSGRRRAFGITLHPAWSEQLHEDVAQGVVEAALCYVMPEKLAAGRMRVVPLYEEEFYLVGSSNALRASIEEVEASELRNFDIVQSRSAPNFLEGLRAAGGSIGDITEVQPLFLCRDMLLHSEWHSIVPFGMFSEDIRMGRLAARRLRPNLNRTTGLIFREGYEVESTGLLEVLGRFVDASAKQELGWRVPGPDLHRQIC